MPKPRATPKPTVDVWPRIRYNLRPIVRDLSQIAVAANARVSELEGHHRRGKTAGHVGWRRVVGEVFAQKPAGHAEVWARLLGLARLGKLDDEIEDVVIVDRGACPAECPRGYHLHCRDARDRPRSVSYGTFKNHVSGLRRDAKAASA